jgi:hypothetical protein
MSEEAEEINGHKIGGDTYYKVLVDGESCNGGDFEYDLPNDGEPGDWTPEIDDIEPCQRGYHLTNDPRQWLSSGCDIYIAEGRGKEKDCSDDKKVFESVRLIKKATFNTGNNNNGEFNSGNRNSGDGNSGNRNSGNGNSGDGNSGYRNSGYRNSGDGNSGYGNSGNGNSGNGNSGDWNSGDFHSGSFNTGTPKFVELFNKKIPYEEYKKINFPNWFYIETTVKDGDCDVGSYKRIPYKEAWKNSFDDALPSEVKKATELPNFDYDVFEEVTGISREMIEEKLND